jgi:hypothetical protein
LIDIRFIYEAETEESRAIAEEVGTYVIADFSPPIDIRIRLASIEPSAPRSLEEGEEWVYLRREAQIDG